jgi:hypothetical protein
VFDNDNFLYSLYAATLQHKSPLILAVNSLRPNFECRFHRSSSIDVEEARKRVLYCHVTIRTCVRGMTDAY